MFSFLKPAADAKEKVPADKVKSTYTKYQIGAFIAILVGYSGYYVVRQVFTVEQQDIMHVYHFSTSQFGVILSCFGIGYGISKLFMGAFSDKSDSNRYLATGLIVSSILNFLFGTTRNFFVICLLMIVMAAAQGMGAAACQRIIQLWWGKTRRGFVYAVWNTSKSFGSLICVSAIQLAAFLFSHSISMVFFTTGIIGIFMGVIVLIFGNDRPAAVGLPSISEYTGDEVVLDSGKKTNEELTDLNVVQILVRYILKDKLVWAVTLTSMFLYLVHYGVISWIPSYLIQFKGFSPTFAKWLVGIFDLAAIPGIILGGFLSDIFKNRRAAVCAVGVVGVILCLISYLVSNNHAVLVVTLILLSNFMVAPINLVGLIINEVVPKFAVRTSTGFMGFFQYIVGETAATAMIGFLVEKFGWGMNITVLFVAAGFALLLLLYIMSTEKKLEKA